MTDFRKKIGKFGEDLACEYLVEKGYKILARNYRKLWGEIDIIAKSADKTLVFVEVKTLTQLQNGLTPEMHITPRKLRILRRACQIYTGKYPELIDNYKGWRIDLIAVSLKRNSRVSIRHYQNI